MKRYSLMLILLCLLAFASGWWTCGWWRQRHMTDGYATLAFTADQMEGSACNIELGDGMCGADSARVAETFRIYAKWIREAMESEPTDAQ